MGHIELAAPVTHIWYFKGIPSRMGLVLDMSSCFGRSYLLRIIRCYRPGDTALEKKQLMTEREYREKLDEYGNKFNAKMGAEAIKELLQDV